MPADVPFQSPRGGARASYDRTTASGTAGLAAARAGACRAARSRMSVISSPTSSLRSMQRRGQRLQHGAVLGQLAAGGFLGLGQEHLDPLAGVVVGQNLGHDPGRHRPRLDGVERDERAAHAERTDHLGRQRGGVGEVAGRAGRRRPEGQLLGHHPAEGDGHQGLQLVLGAGEALLGVGVRQEPEGVPALDDRQDLEIAVADQVGDDGVAAFVGGDPALLAVGVLHRLLEADLLGELGLLHVGPGHGRHARPAAPTPDPRRRGARSSPASSRRSWRPAPPGGRPGRAPASWALRSR